MEKERTDLQIAEERAARRFPPPRYQPFDAGGAGAFIAMAIVGLFTIFAGLPTDSFERAYTTTVIVGFLVPYFSYKHQERKHSAETMRIMIEMREARNAKRTKGSEAPRLAPDGGGPPIRG